MNLLSGSLFRLLGCALSFVAPAALAAASSGYLASDLDRDGTIEYVSITHTRIVNGRPMGGDIVVSHRVNGKIKSVWRQSRLNPWKVEIGDVDGDGRPELVAGVWKKSRYDPVFAKRTFVYSWNGRRLAPKWLGSRLSRRFTDFVLCPLDRDGKTELVALEEAPGGANYLTVYRWRAFGFEWVGRVGPVKGVRSLRVEKNEVLVVTGKGTGSLKLLRPAGTNSSIVRLSCGSRPFPQDRGHGKLKFTLISEAGNGRASVR